MFLTSLKWKLDPEAIRGTPEAQGVYGLWDQSELVYIGTSERNRPLSQALAEVLKLQQQGAIQATHFAWEITVTPRSWAGELLRLHVNKHGGLPRYNHASGPFGHGPQADVHAA